MQELSAEQISRYKNQLNLPGMSPGAQSLLLASKVLILGNGDWAYIAAQYLAAAGAGTIGYFDGSTISADGVLNSYLHMEGDVDKSRVQVANKTLSKINPETRVVMHAESFNAHNAEQIIVQYSLVIDGLKDWQDKLLASDVCMHLRKTLVHCGCFDFNFQYFVMVPGRSSCLRCAFNQMGMEDISNLRSDNNFLPVLGMAGACQASEAIKILAGIGVAPGDELVRFDALRREFYTVNNLGPQLDCPDCGSLSSSGF